MDSFIKRSLVGLAYACVWVASLFCDYPEPYILLLIVIAYVASFEMLNLFNIRSLILHFTLCAGTIGLIFFNVMMIYIAIISVACQLLLAWLLFMRKSLPLHSPILGCFLCLTHLLFPIFIISEVSFAELPLFTTELTLGLLFFIWGTDAMAYSFGTLFGKTPLFRAVSPKKSVEGAVAAVLFSPVIAFINVQFFSNDDYYYWLVMGILISITSIVGDLVQSQFKRTYGVKNSGTILLGHGGMYDRIDSLIFTIPFIYLFIYIFQ